MHVRINQSWIIPNRITNVHVSVVKAEKPVTLYLPAYRNGIIVNISQFSEVDITVDCNSANSFTWDRKQYRNLIFTAARVNTTKTLRLVARYNHWVLQTPNVNFTFEGLLCQDTPLSN